MNCDIMRFVVVCAVLAVSACRGTTCQQGPKTEGIHRRYLTKGDFDAVAALMYSPYAPPADELVRKLGPPARVQDAEYVWLAKEGTVCWAMYVDTAPAEDRGFDGGFLLTKHDCTAEDEELLK